jgi:hypothetical protein
LSARRVEEPVDVLLEPEDAALVEADALEDAVAVQESVIEDGDLCVCLVVEGAVDVDLEHGGAADMGARTWRLREEG